MHLKLEGVFVRLSSFFLLFFGTRNCADYFELHDCKIVLLNCGQILAFVENFGIKHRGYFICFVTPFMFKLSRVTWNHCLSIDDVYSHKWCPSETCAYMFY